MTVKFLRVELHGKLFWGILIDIISRKVAWSLVVLISLEHFVLQNILTILYTALGAGDSAARTRSISHRLPTSTIFSTDFRILPIEEAVYCLI